ncbi:hypothetical protein BGZ79_007083 [Entomortierella chlamydospora]|nr:hypothetical protein BGZ79_007083 [Entomortierella chlamydospora]
MTASSKPSPQASSGAASPSIPSGSQPGSWSGIRPVADNAPAVTTAEAQNNRPIVSSVISLPVLFTSTTTGHEDTAAAAASESAVAPNSSAFTSSTLVNDSTGFKIRIPRDLPNIPPAFRKRGAIRSQPSVSSNARFSPVHPSAARPRSTESEPLYQTKLVVSPREPVDNGKRTHNDMLSEDSQAPRNYLMLEPRVGSEKKAKTIKPETDTPEPPKMSRSSSANSLPIQDNVPVRDSTTNPTPELTTHIIPPETQPSTSAYTIKDNIKQEEPTDIPMASVSRLKRQRSRTKSEPDSPTPTPVRFPTPTSIGRGIAGDIEEAPQDLESTPMESVVLSAPVAPLEPNDISVASADSNSTPVAEAGSSSASSQPIIETPPNMPETTPIKPEEIETSTKEQLMLRENSTPPLAHSTVNSTPDPNEPTLKPIELVRLGTTVLDRLLSNPVCKNFVNRVPDNVANYHAVIKKPMDLMTIEHKLWKSLVTHQSALDSSLAPGAIIAAKSYNSSSEGYVNLQEFEKDLQRIYRNAIYFNPPQQVIYKEAQSYEVLYKGLLNALREHRLIPASTVAQEHYTPSLITLSEPGPIYLFRVHQVREMERKMTDISVDLFAALHQPLLEIMYTSDSLSPEKPQFARLYINKNRSLLDSCRDDLQAKVVIFSDYHFKKASSAAGGGPKSGGNSKMVGIKARAMIVKPIGERHEMITVGDLDCPSAWIMVACVKTFDWEVNIPAKFEKGVLSKMRHEVIPFGPNSKLSPEHQQNFLDSVGLRLRDFVPPTIVKSEPVQLECSLSSVNDSGPAAVELPPPYTGDNITSSALTSSVMPNQEEMVLLKPKIERQDINPSERLIPDSIESSPEETSIAHETAQYPGFLLPPMPSSPLSATPDVTLNSIQDIKRDSTPIAEQSAGARSLEDRLAPMDIDPNSISSSSGSNTYVRSLTPREQKMLRDLKAVSREKNVPYISWSSIEPTLTVDSAHGLFKRIYHVQGNDGLVVQNFKEMDAESFEQRVREVVCLLKLRGSEGIGQIQAIIDDEKDHLVGLSMTKYAYTLKAYATSARRHPSPRQKLSLVRDMVSAISAIHRAGLAHRDLSEVNIMVDEDSVLRLEDNTPKPWVRVIDFGKSVFIEPEEVKRWSVLEPVSEDVIRLLPLVVLPPDHGYKLYRSILTLPRTKFDHSPLPPVDPRLEDVYSLGVLIWRTFSGKSPWNGAIEDDLKTIRYLVRTDSQIKFQLEREVTGRRSRELLLKCLTADPVTRSTSHQLKEWLEQPEILADLLSEFEALGGGRKRVRKNLD